MAAVSLVAVRPGHGDPGDIFTVGAPAIGSAPPMAKGISDGDAAVSTQTGAFSYAYPIAVPPGRNGMQPQISLSYSSQGAIYGGVAAGWSLSGIHAISLDTSNGRLVAPRYQSSLAGGRPLVQVSEPSSGGATTFRAKNDSSWTRYELLGDSPTGAKWRAYTTDGTTWYFGETGHGACPTFTAADAPLTRAVDKFGNEVWYAYANGPQAECRIDFITWGQNSNIGMQHFATVKFNFAESPSCLPNLPIGSQLSWRTGALKGTGTSRLNSITVAAHTPGIVAPGVIPTTPDHRRTITLSYDAATENCAATHAPFRQLASVQETAVGIDSPQVSLPAVTFTYGSAAFGSGALAWPAPTQPPTTPWTNAHPVSGASIYNLGWGYRYRPSEDKLPTVEEMMIDLDGDGLVDRLTNSPVRDGNGVVRCEALWQRNQGPGLTFAAPVHIALPTLKWASPGSGLGSPNATPGLKEGCSLNYQQTRFVNALSLGGHNCPGGGSCPTSGPTTGYCAIGKHDCRNTSGSAGDTVLAYRWIDLDGDQLVDLVVSPTKGGLNSYNFYKGDQPYAQAVESPLVFGDFAGAYAECPTSSLSPAPSELYRMCGNKVPWFFYKNKGNGVFGETSGLAWPYPTRVLYQPMPLETAAGESSMTSYPTGQYQGVLDLDGDGLADGAKTGSTAFWTSWAVWRNDRTGFLASSTPSAAFHFNTGTNYAFSRSNWQANFSNVKSLEGMLDIHGDGLADHWVNDPNFGPMAIAINDGAGLRYPPEITPTVTPANETSSICGTLCYDSSGTFPVRAYRRDMSKTIDLDLDGRADVAQSYTGAWNSRLNLGGNFGNAVSQIGWAPALYRTIVATDQIPVYAGAPAAGAYAWELRTDMLDLDGDGIPEGVDFSSNIDNWFTPQPYQLSKINTPNQPPRILVGINNGRGASTSIAYAAMSNTAAVTQAPGKRMPHTQWVVHEMETIDSLAVPQTTSTTSYAYTNPVFSADDEARFAFRGFEKAVTTTPSGAKREDTYSFSPDWSGRLARTVTRPAEALSEARTIDETTWEERTLFAGVLKTYHPTVKKHYVCANGQTEAVCGNPANAAGYSQVTSTLTALATSKPGGSTTPLMWQETSSQQQRGTLVADGDRRVDTQHGLYADGAAYRLVALNEIKLHRVAGVFTMYARTDTNWENSAIGDTSRRVAWETAVWTDSNPANIVVTARDFDLETGNVIRAWKPAQWMPNPNRSTNPLATQFGYDDRKLFPAVVVNELAHSQDHTYEYGTGTKLSTRGPNTPSCAPSSCPPGTPLKEEQRIRVDGLGRMIERFEAFKTGTSYLLHKVETNAYTDAPNPTPSVVHQAAIDYNAGTIRYAVDVAELDGHGRPIRTTVFALGSAAANQVTSYSYNHDGTLAQVTVPDPTADNTSTVAYTYTYDSLGRPLTMRRPDAIAPNDRSGVNIC